MRSIAVKDSPEKSPYIENANVRRRLREKIGYRRWVRQPLQSEATPDLLCDRYHYLRIAPRFQPVHG